MRGRVTMSKNKERLFEDLVSDFLANGIANDLQGGENELVFGYDETDIGLDIDAVEEEITMYIYLRAEELDSLSYDKILKTITDEIKKGWPSKYKAMIDNQIHNYHLYLQRFSSPQKPKDIDFTIEEIPNEDLWKKVQAKLAENNHCMERTTV